MIQVYTGNGKGKTTAAYGLALRAAGAGQKVYIGQFVKGGGMSSVLNILENIDNIKIKQFGRNKFIQDPPDKEDIQLARAGLKEMASVLKQSTYDLVILDEANIAVYFGLIKLSSLLRVLNERDSHIEVVITGRNADIEMIEAADLVTEMNDIKHYYNQGVKPREGIEY